jgi:hypothetical protein
MDTSRIDGVKAPQHRGTPRSHLARLEAVVEAQSADVAVRADALDARHLPHVAGGRRHGDVCGHLALSSVF